MTGVKFFQDGDRFVVVFEGLEGPGQEDLIKSLIGSVLSGAEVKAEPPVEAEPVEPKEVEIPVSRFEDGPFAGMTPDEVVLQKCKGIQYLIHERNAAGENLKVDIEKALRGHLQNFASCEEESYAKKLTDKQVDRFLATYKGLIPTPPTDASYDIKRQMVAKGIKKFKKII